jgi:hypothetical protein
VSKTGRTYGEKPSRPIYVWNGILEPKHRERIGPAIWLFLYFIDRTTKERPNKHNPDEIEGWVYGKMPLTLPRMASETGLPVRTISAHLLRLECHGYIRTVRAPHGLIILVQKSGKWLKSEKAVEYPVGSKRSAENGVSRYAENGVSRAKSCVSRAENGVCRKDKAVDLSGEKEIGGESTAHSAAFAPPLSDSNSESQSQPQEKTNPNPVLTGKTQSPRPYTDSLLRSGLGVASLCEIPKPKRQYVPKTEAQIQDDLRKVREMFPEQFAKAGKVAGA